MTVALVKSGRISSRTRRRALGVARLATLVLVSLFSLIPIYWTAVTSVKGVREIFQFPPSLFPSNPGLENFQSVLTGTGFGLNFRNSLIITFFTVLLTLSVSLPAGYVASRFNFRGKRGLMFLLLATIMIPSIIVLVPQYSLAVQFGLYNTFAALVLIFGAAQVPVAVWLARGFFDSIPLELEEAAFLDGCGRMRVLWHIIRPLSGNIIATISIIAGIWSWGELLVSLTLTNSDAHRPIMVGLFFFLGEAGIEWGPLTAAATMSLIPMIAAFVFLRRQFVSGMTSGTIK